MNFKVLHVEFSLQSPQLEGAEKTLQKLREMHPHMITIVARKDGQNIVFDGDFLKHTQYVENG